MGLTMEKPDLKWFQENMGRGGAIPLGPKPEPKQQSLSEEKPKDQEVGSLSEAEEEAAVMARVKALIQKDFDEAKPVSDYEKLSPSEKTGESISPTGEGDSQESGEDDGMQSFSFDPEDTDLKEDEAEEREPVIDLTSLHDWPSGYLQSISSDLTVEQRNQADHDEIYMCGPIGRLQVRLRQRGIPRQWAIEFGWPGVLDKIREYSRNNNIKLIEPESYLSGDILVTHE